jgi:hypothetical protein
VENYIEEPREAWPPNDEMQHTQLKWCDERIRVLLARGLNLNQRYALYRASLCEPFATREDQSTQLHKSTKLVRLPCRISSQLPVVSPLQRYILNHIAGNEDESEPMVMVFAGPPGHGKTGLAEQLRGLRLVNHTTIACSANQVCH